MGPLGLSSPRLQSRNLAAPELAVLRIATTTFVHPGWFALGSRPVPWVDARLFVSLLACARVGSPTAGVGRWSPGCWLRRSPHSRRSPFGSATDPVANLGSGGIDRHLLTHPLGNIDEFQGASPLFLHPGPFSARPVILLGHRDSNIVSIPGCSAQADLDDHNTVASLAIEARTFKRALGLRADYPRVFIACARDALPEIAHNASAR